MHNRRVVAALKVNVPLLADAVLPKISEALGTYPDDALVFDSNLRRGGAVLNRKQRAMQPVPRIFNGEKEAGSLPWPARNLPTTRRTRVQIPIKPGQRADILN
jgi:hypothetical protein